MPCTGARSFAETRPFYGAAVEVERGQVSGTPLPRRLEGARGVSLSLPGQADVETVAAAISAATDLPVNIRTRYVQADGSVVRVPIGTKMAVDGYEGPLSAFLDRLAARMDVAWSYDGTVVTIDRMTRRTWRVALPLGVTEMSDSADLAQGAVSVTTSRQLDPWQELERRLAPMAPPPAAVTVSRETGRVEVFGPPSVLKSVGEVLDDVAEVAAMRVGLEVAVYWVSTTRADESGFGISASRDFGPAAVTLAAAAAGDASGGLLISRGASSLDFKALASDSAVVDYRIANTVVQSGVVAPIALTTEQNYVYSVSYEPAEDSGPGGAPGTTGPEANPSRRRGRPSATPRAGRQGSRPRDANGGRGAGERAGPRGGHGRHPDLPDPPARDGPRAGGAAASRRPAPDPPRAHPEPAPPRPASTPRSRHAPGSSFPRSPTARSGTRPFSRPARRLYCQATSRMRPQATAAASGFSAGPGSGAAPRRGATRSAWCSWSGRP